MARPSQIEVVSSREAALALASTLTGGAEVDLDDYEMDMADVACYEAFHRIAAI